MPEILPQHKMDSSKVTNANIFPTTLLSYKWENSEEFNKELRNAILEKEKENKGKQVSNVGGFHSEWDLLTWDYPCIKVFIDRIHQMCGYMAKTQGLKDDGNIDLSLAAWGNVCRSGHYHTIHKHPNNFWSGCYYVADGDPDKDVQYNGYFEFLDPRAGANMLTTDSLPFPRYQIIPTPGVMTMFPSYVEHYVHRYIGEGERISISFNVRVIEPKPKTKTSV